MKVGVMIPHTFSFPADTNSRFLFMTLFWKFGQQNEYWNSRSESGLPALLFTSHAVFSIWIFLAKKGSWVMISHIGTLKVQWRPALKHLCCFSLAKLCLFATLWTAARQAPLSFTMSQSLLSSVHLLSRVHHFATP